MKSKKGIYRLISLILICLIVLAMTGCGTKDEPQQNQSGSQANGGGSLLIMGSTALQPLAEQAANSYKGKNPNVSIQVQGGGSGNGLTAVSQGTAQIGNSDITAEEKGGIDPKALEDHKVCVVGFAAIVNSNVNIDNLTKQQLVDIFTGKIDNWSKVGGSNTPIVLISRPAGSGTRATFKKYALGGAEEVTGKSLTEDSSGTVLKAVSDTPGAISYIGLSYIKGAQGVKAVKLDGVDPTAENITSGKYPIWSYEHMYTKGPAQGLAKSFIDYIMSDEAKPLVTKLGYIPVSDMKVTR